MVTKATLASALLECTLALGFSKYEWTGQLCTNGRSRAPAWMRCGEQVLSLVRCSRGVLAGRLRDTSCPDGRPIRCPDENRTVHSNWSATILE